MHLHPHKYLSQEKSNTNMYFSVSPQKTYLGRPKRQRYLLVMYHKHIQIAIELCTE